MDFIREAGSHKRFDERSTCLMPPQNGFGILGWVGIFMDRRAASLRQSSQKRSNSENLDPAKPYHIQTLPGFGRNSAHSSEFERNSAQTCFFLSFPFFFFPFCFSLFFIFHFSYVFLLFSFFFFFFLRVPRQRNTSTAQSWRFVPDAILPGHRRAHWWVPAWTPTVHQCPHSGKAVGGSTAHGTGARNRHE